MENNNVLNRAEETKEIDLLELARVLWGRLWLLILGLIVGAVAAFSISRYMLTPQYDATSMIYIFSKSTSITSLADIQIGNQLTTDFTIIAKTREVLQSVIDELQLNTDYAELSKRVTVTNPNSSHMLEIKVRDPNPQTAADISNTLSEKLREQIAEIMNTDKPSIVQRAVVPVSQSSPRVMRNTAIGALAGLVLIAGIQILRYMTDDTIKDNEDVTKYLGLDTLAAFPFVKGQSQTGHSRRRRSRIKTILRRLLTGGNKKR